MTDNIGQTGLYLILQTTYRSHLHVDLCVGSSKLLSIQLRSRRNTKKVIFCSIIILKNTVRFDNLISV